jgi:hypothetical protein
VGSVERTETEYFLGLLVTSDDGADQPLRLVDGQQRTTTLILLLKALAELGSKEIAARINVLIDPSPSTFVMTTPGFRDALETVAKETTKSRKGRKRRQNSQMERLAEAFRVIDDKLRSAIGDDKEELEAFAAWVLTRVYLVDLVDTDPYDDQLLFDRINTRGLLLSGADTFRSRIASQVGRFSKFNFISDWRRARTKAAEAYGLSPTASAHEAERAAMIAWLVARYAASASDAPVTLKAILKEPYDWAWGNLRDSVGGEERVPDLFRKDFFPLVEALANPLSARTSFDRELAGFFSAALVKIPLTDALAAACCQPSRKAQWAADVRLASRFLDTMTARMMWGTGWCVTNAQRQDVVLRAIRATAQHTGETLRGMLRGILADSPGFSAENAPSLTPQNRIWIRYFLCRLADHLEKSLRNNNISSMLFARVDRPEIEHVMGSRFEDYAAAFPSARIWQQQRERLGALVVLPKSVNAALRETSYEGKLPHYAKQNALAASLAVPAYEAALTRLKGSKHFGGLPIRPVEEMSALAINERETLYCAIAEQIWPRQI